MGEYVEVRQVRLGTRVALIVGDPDHKVRLDVVMGDEAVRALIRELQQAIGEAPSAGWMAS